MPVRTAVPNCVAMCSLLPSVIWKIDLRGVDIRGSECYLSGYSPAMWGFNGQPHLYISLEFR